MFKVKIMRLKKRTKIKNQLDKLTALAVMVDYGFNSNEKTANEIIKIRNKINKLVKE